MTGRVRRLSAQAGVVVLAAVTSIGGHTLWVHHLESKYKQPDPLSVVTPHPEFGHGGPSALEDARITPDGQLQVMYLSGDCEALSHVTSTDGSNRTVDVTAYAVRFPGDCDAVAISYWAAVPGDHASARRVVDAHTGKPVLLVDCRARAALPHRLRGLCNLEGIRLPS